MMKKLFKCIMIYIVFYIFDIFIFSGVLFMYRHDINQRFIDFLYYQFLNRNIEIDNNAITGIIYFVQNIVEISAVAIFTGFIFAYILNREPKIVFPDKLVVRHRTSWEAKNKITLGILVGNKSKYNIHNVVCSLTCSYIKKENPLLINNEFVLTDERILLENYYRFSFDLSKFPKQILKDIIKKPSYYDKETIVVSITGNCNYLGNSFKVSKKYKLSDIVYDEHVPIISKSIKNIFTGKELINPFSKKAMIKIDWEEFRRIIDADENQRSISVNEIRYIIKNKKR